MYGPVPTTHRYMVSVRECTNARWLGQRLALTDDHAEARAAARAYEHPHAHFAVVLDLDTGESECWYPNGDSHKGPTFLGMRRSTADVRVLATDCDDMFLMDVRNGRDTADVSMLADDQTNLIDLERLRCAT